MTTARKPRKKAVREYRKDTFQAYQDRAVREREHAVHEVLVLLGKSQLKFSCIKQLAEHVCALLEKDARPCNVTTLIRKHHTKGGAEAPNPYRLLLQKYMLGKYFGKGKNLNITAADTTTIRRQYPAIDAYCALIEGDSKALQERVKRLTIEVDRLQGQGRNSLQQANGVPRDFSDQLDKTVTALKRLLDATEGVFDVDWQRRAIVDMSKRNPEVVVEPDLLSAFFTALENCGMSPTEGI